MQKWTRESINQIVKNFFWPELPVLEKKDEILASVQQNSVTILQAETGSGKTTQLPKICLQAQFATRGLIGLTQPRRIAALSITDRLREETKTPEIIGSKIRFREDIPKNSLIRVMTDGILLQEFHHDPLLRKYSCIILDEAHERSLNIDFLLGIFKTILKKRKDFRLIISSATIDAKLFAKFYENAHIIPAEGRTYPVQVKYQEIDVSKDLSTGVVNAILPLMECRDEICLCFLPTESDIHECEDALESKCKGRFEIRSLYGRMSPAEQKKVFRTPKKNRVILATNIAETSITIPGITSVIDSGFARISRYHSRTRIQGLPIEAISKASAEQRRGRAGRTRPGQCIRLYSEENFRSRPDFSEPEILRSGLEGILLKLISLRLNPKEFPFLDSPKKSAFRGAMQHLFELKAVTNSSLEAHLTPLGKKMARMPVDPVLSRILLEGEKRKVSPSVSVVAAAISIQDPRIFPPPSPERSKADSLHNRFTHTSSDLLALLKLWNFTQKVWQEKPTWGKLSSICRENMLSFPRMREWVELNRQFCSLLNIPPAGILESIDEDSFHQSFLVGFLGNIAKKIPKEYAYQILGGEKGFLFPGSGLFKKKPNWVACTELRETSKLWLNRVFEINPEWIVFLAKDFCSIQILGENYNSKTGFVEALERVSFRGLIVQPGLRIQLQKADPVRCREIFWTDAVASGKLQPCPAFLQHDLRVLQSLRKTAKKLRRPEIIPSSHDLSTWFLDRAPNVCSRKALQVWLQNNSDESLRFCAEDWGSLDELDEFRKYLKKGTAATEKLIFPSKIKTKQGHIKVDYPFHEKAPLEGIVMRIPEEELDSLDALFFLKNIVAWRKRIWEWFLRYQPGEIRKKLLAMEEQILQKWLNSKYITDSVILELIHTIEQIDEELGNNVRIPKQRNDSLCIHIYIQNQKQIFAPWTFPVEWFQTCSKLNFNQPHIFNLSPLSIFVSEKKSFDYKISKTEIDFTKNFLKQTSQTHNASQQSLQENELQKNALQNLKAQFESLHLSNFETFKSHLLQHAKVASNDIFWSQISNSFLKKNSVQFTKKQKVRDFSDLNSKKQPISNMNEYQTNFLRFVASSLLDSKDFLKFVSSDLSLKSSVDFDETILRDPYKNPWKTVCEINSNWKDEWMHSRIQFIRSFKNARSKLKHLKDQLLKPEAFPKNIQITLDRFEKGKFDFEEAVDGFILLKTYESELLTRVYSRPRTGFQKETIEGKKLQQLKNMFSK